MMDIIFGMLITILYIGIVSAAIWVVILAFKERDGFYFFMASVLILLCLIPVAYIFDGYQKDIAIQDTQTVQAEVTDKVYHPPTTRVMIVNKTTIITPVAAKHLVTISSEQHTHTFNNESMYTSFQLGDKFKVELISYTSKAGKVFDKEFKFLNQTP